MNDLFYNDDTAVHLEENHSIDDANDSMNMYQKEFTFIRLFYAIFWLLA